MGKGCRGINNKFVLPPFYQYQSNNNLTDHFSELISTYNFGNILTWQPVIEKFPRFNLMKIPKKLKQIKEISSTDLIKELGYLEEITPFYKKPNFWMIFGITLIVLIVVSAILFCCRKRILTKIRQLTALKISKIPGLI